jgi:acetyl-CoA C-acetyltransferase/acetyl-CoA acyltransferase
MRERIAIIHAIRSPFSKAGSALQYFSADDLGAVVLTELMQCSPISYQDVEEVIVGNVAQPAHAANIARVIALKAGFSQSVSAFTVHRNCASGMEAISTAAFKLWSGRSRVIVAGGTESMSNIPLLFNSKMKSFFENLAKSKTFIQKLKVLSTFRMSYLSPVIGIVQGLTDPVCGLIMGLTAENLAREFKISRLEQDQFALESHQKALQSASFLKEEFFSVPLKPYYHEFLSQDDGPRASQNLEALQKLKPYFDTKNGTVTVGNSCPLTDGACFMVLMTESEAKNRGLTPLGYIRDFAYAGLQPERMGLGPVYATSKLLDQTGLQMRDFDLVELNEAFAVQVLANLRAFDSDHFSQVYLGKSKALGALNPDRLNKQGGAIALGHPVGTTGARLVLTLLKQLRRYGLHRGLATLCIGGGQGGSMIVEVD